jgi:hypothetical protein
MRLSPLGTLVDICPIVPAPADRWWVWSSRWNENWQGKPKYLEKDCPSATLSTTIPTWPDRGSNSGRREGKPATNRLSYGAAELELTLSRWFFLDKLIVTEIARNSSHFGKADDLIPSLEVRISSHLNQVRTLTSFIRKIHFNLISHRHLGTQVRQLFSLYFLTAGSDIVGAIR